MKLSDLVVKHGDKLFEAVEIELRKLAAELPDFVYKSNTNKSGACRYNGPSRAQYMENGKLVDSDGELLGPDCAGCIFGQALQRLGWSEHSELNLVADISDLFIMLVNHPKLSFVPRGWLHTQKIQDTGGTWAEAIETLDREEYKKKVIKL